MFVIDLYIFHDDLILIIDSNLNINDFKIQELSH